MGPRLLQAGNFGLGFAGLFFVCAKLLERELTFEKLGVHSVTPNIYKRERERERERRAS